MLKNNVEVDVKVNCIEGDVTQAKLAEEIGTSAPYISRLIRNNEKIVNKTFLQLMEKLGYDVELTYVVVPQIKRNSILHIIRDCFCDVSMNNSRLFDADSALYFI